MQKIIATLIWILFSIAMAIVCAYARDSQPVVPSTHSRAVTSTSLVSPEAPAWIDIAWPTRWASLQTGKINAAFGSNGTLGLPFGDFQIDYPFWPRAGFETPPASGLNYLYGASIWVGGILNGDTLVSTGDDGWFNVHEFYPANYAGTVAGSIRPEELTGASSLRSDCADTLQAGVSPAPQSAGGPHLPLNISMTNRARIWTDPPFNNCILYDLTITNIGAQAIHSGYVGIYVDGDVYGPNSAIDGASDDIAGSIRNRGIAYIIDNDGDSKSGAFVPGSSPTGILAFKFLASSFLPTDSSFNWWLTQRTTQGYQDFGPQQRARSRQFGLGGSGQPLNDRERYFLMSGQEWDYDQVQLPAIADNDSSWIAPPDSTASSWCQGADARFLMSLGPFELPPDSSVRVVYSLFTGDSVHIDPHIMDYLPIVPELYTRSLNFTHLFENADAADSLARGILDPASPPTGLQAQTLTPSTVSLSWDPWCFRSIEGYNLYLLAIPDSAYPHRGVIPPWFRPNQTDLAAQPGFVTRAALSGLSPDKAYSVSISTRFANQSGRQSEPIFLHSGAGENPPVMLDTIIFPDSSGVVRFHWTIAAGSYPEHFNVYKFSDSASADQKYSPHYSLRREQYPIVDSVVRDGATYFYYALPVFATLSGNTQAFRDSASADGNQYAVTAVDSFGFESGFSETVAVFRPVRSKDILVITNSNPTGNFVTVGTVAEFYGTVLRDFSFDVYSLADTLLGVQCPDFSPSCFDWHDLMRYRMVIIDDGLADGVLDYRMESSTGAFTKYLLSGGRLAYFGSFAEMRPTPLRVDTPPGFFPAGSSFATRFFGIDSVFYVGTFYFEETSTPPFVDTLFAFQHAEGSSTLIPSVAVDTGLPPFSPRLRNYWPRATVPSVSSFKVNPRGTVTHSYRSSHPSTSVNESQPVGVVTPSETTQTYAFGFHLWYMNAIDARHLVEWITGRTPSLPDDSTPTQPVARFALAQNYPNPFNPTTRISFDLPKAGQVLLEIFNVLGQRIRTLVNQANDAGHYEVVWDGRDAGGSEVASGVYLYRLRTDAVTLSRKMLLIR